MSLVVQIFESKVGLAKRLVYLCRKDPYCSRKAKPFLRSRASSTSLKWGDIADCKKCSLGSAC